MPRAIIEPTLISLDDVGRRRDQASLPGERVDRLRHLDLQELVSLPLGHRLEEGLSRSLSVDPFITPAHGARHVDEIAAEVALKTPDAPHVGAIPDHVAASLLEGQRVAVDAVAGAGRIGAILERDSKVDRSLSRLSLGECRKQRRHKANRCDSCRLGMFHEPSPFGILILLKDRDPAMS